MKKICEKCRKTFKGKIYQSFCPDCLGQIFLDWRKGQNQDNQNIMKDPKKEVDTDEELETEAEE